MGWVHSSVGKRYLEEQENGQGAQRAERIKGIKEEERKKKTEKAFARSSFFNNVPMSTLKITEKHRVVERGECCPLTT